jgi:uncharacterized protein
VRETRDFPGFRANPPGRKRFPGGSAKVQKSRLADCVTLAKKRRMSDLEQQLAELRARVKRVASACDQKYAACDQKSAAAAAEPSAELSGNEVQTAFGKHLERDTLYPAHRQHGSADIGALSELPRDLLAALSAGSIPDAAPEEWAFLDTETTGLAGGTGTCAFLVGVGRIARDGFRVRQFFMRDYGEEASLLEALARHLEPFRVIITYNGRAFDQPLLETRYRMHRARPPFTRMEHLDLLYGARRLWKLRFESCRLVDLESQVLGVEREGDIPGALIPFVYFEYLRARRAARLLPVFEHNALDILSLACLTGIVPYAFKDPANVPLGHGSEMVGLARWLEAAGDRERGRAMLRRAIDAGLPDHLLFRALWDLAQLERKLECEPAALSLWEDLAAAKNPFRVRALEELAKHHEHRAKDRAAALRCTRAAREIEDSEQLAHREARLVKQLGRHLSTARTRALL